MCIALPNTEKTFTVTLFLPANGDPGFDKIRDPAQARAFFSEVFPDALEKIADFDYDWQHNPESALATLSLDTWHYADRIVLIGDAAHAMVPFHGQGMNCAFEDCLALVDAIESENDWAAAIGAYEAARRDNAAAIQAMALENYVEMRDKVDDKHFLLERTLERELAIRHPDRFIPRYSMVSFQRVPYALAFHRGKIQRGPRTGRQGPGGPPAPEAGWHPQVRRRRRPEEGREGEGRRRRSLLDAGWATEDDADQGRVGRGPGAADGSAPEAWQGLFQRLYHS
jgi:kynurenine 3-monooxygenase